LGYEHREGAWRHPEHIAVFVGDLIDRGPEQLATLRLVRSMVDAGTAQIVLGNHEFNAVAWSTYDIERGDYCRTHSTKHRGQHGEFLTEVVEGSERHDEWVAWFKTIPLWLDLGGLRVVHACWDQASIEVVKPLMSAGDSLTEELVIAASRKPSDDERIAGTLTPYDAIENLLKGPEGSLGDVRGYLDKDGNSRYHARLRWWDRENMTLDECVVIPPDARSLDGDKFQRVAGQRIADQVPAVYTDDTPVIFGHYWCTKESDVVRAKALCVDYSAAERGPLAAYRWDGESDLTRANLVFF
jgi:Calcineurin-like phosphoesterase